jgi:hypothetical protein
MSIVTPPEKTSGTLQCAGGFRNGFSDFQNALSRQNRRSPENRSFFWHAHWDSRFFVTNGQFREKAIGNTFRENSTFLAVQRSVLPSVVPIILPNREG